MKNSDTITITTNENGTPYTGTLTENYDNGIIHSQRTFKDGYLNGPFKIFYPDGRIFCEGSYNKFKRYEGIFKQYDDNGHLKIEESYIDGIKNGRFKFYKDGQLKLEGHHKDGKVDGVCKSYDENGKFLYELFYMKPIDSPNWLILH